MGIIRLLLALTVVVAHTNPIFGNKIVGGITSVHAFFIISGFYMALILNEKYTDKKSYKLYITNRLLRLYPVYWIMLVLIIILSVFAYKFSSQGSVVLQPYIGNFHNMSFFSSFYLAISNLTLIGQDWLMFMGFDSTTGNLFYTPYHSGAWKFIIITQSWTVGVEIIFYIFAPLIVRRNTVVLSIIVIASLILRVIIYKLGFENDPWTFRFLPTELAFFIAGALSYKAYRFLKSKNINHQLNLSILIFMIAFTLFFQYIPIEMEYKQWLYYLLIALTIPFMFIVTKKSKIDHWIGELTYPVYMSHIFIFMILGFLYKFTKMGAEYSGIVTLIFSVLFSILLVKFVVEPVEKIRQNRVKQSKTVNKV